MELELVIEDLNVYNKDTFDVLEVEKLVHGKLIKVKQYKLKPNKKEKRSTNYVRSTCQDIRGSIKRDNY